MKHLITFAAVVSLGLGLAGCGNTQGQRTATGALIGGTGGAVVGNAVGGTGGAIVGGVAGGTAGAVVGNRM
ncbi:YMGG-like glycine zipper-containing protein [Chthonobacter rhizosphaerae]|uniref:YMGG-like glycine zipper-containing protein n=1 Tax=Chthonobacter rhizosphaerae TaxID=2735553 RepID=UPI0015EFA68F|nr:glycine zipper 2TM domain-containing protein [Chthonobacter rhizosphaerae]